MTLRRGRPAVVRRSGTHLVVWLSEIVIESRALLPIAHRQMIALSRPRVLRRRVGTHPTRVFTFRGATITQVNTKAWTAALARASIENFKWHDLHHTFATWHPQAGTPTHELQRLGSWKTGAMVERYAHLAPEALQGAANRLDAFGGYATIGIGADHR
ncbi:MAG: tyrosine-type recombinase/integrase [Burkholderiaceae bacterium]